ncbi:hypothetical protein OCJ37_14310 [Xanthomonas sp. AM6]|uniref:hypothetical protein n=1 Tax=Xanthomonas sp. AM6 TaxID=2982531 RepID=UPI0021D85C96|nr:hypothetical protein [Xanthomonas sp. AM6]UYB51159.1 hypothetical protein OCJ37_14310 [Xanthomonas sp. AM6]
MSKVEILSKGGRVARVHPKIADVLVQRGKYIRRDMVAQAATQPPLAPIADGPGSGQVGDQEEAPPVAKKTGRKVAKKRATKGNASEEASE